MRSGKHCLAGGLGADVFLMLSDWFLFRDDDVHGVWQGRVGCGDGLFNLTLLQASEGRRRYLEDCLAIEAPQGFQGESPYGVNTPDA